MFVSNGLYIVWKWSSGYGGSCCSYVFSAQGGVVVFLFRNTHVSFYNGVLGI